MINPKLRPKPNPVPHCQQIKKLILLQHRANQDLTGHTTQCGTIVASTSENPIFKYFVEIGKVLR